MVQIIKENKPLSLSDRFGNAFGKAAEVIPDYLDKRQKMNAENEALKLQGIDLNGISDPEARKAIIAGSLKSAGEKQDLKTPFLQKLMGENQEFDPSKITDKDIIEASAIDNNLGNQLRTTKDEWTKKQKEEEPKINAQKALNTLKGLVSKVGRGTGLYSLFGGDTARSKGKFQALTGSLEALLVDKVNRGTLSNTRFKYITEDLLPKPTDTQEEILGKLEGLSEILDLDFGGDSKDKSGMSVVGNESAPSKRPRPTAWDSKANAEQNKNTPITVDIVQDLYNKSGGDKEKARQMAIQMGYQL